MTEVRYKVNEQFDSIQGEGILSGIPSTFIRLQGCPVGCSWCDSGPLADELEGKRRTNGLTANTWGAGGEWKFLSEILKEVHNEHVIITGGEPTIWDLDPLILALRAREHTIQLETAGLKPLHNAVPDWITWSPKQNIDFEAPRSLKIWVNEIKFVVDQHLTIPQVQKVIDHFHYENPGRLRGVVMMPEGCPPNKESIAKTLAFVTTKEVDYHSFQVRFGDRLQYRLNMR